MDALRLDRLARNFGGLRATDNVSMAVAPGERRAIIGPNGAGKTTLFNLISGVLMPDGGHVLMYGEDITRYPSHRRARRGLGRTFQRNNLFLDLTVRENVRLAVQQRLGVSADLDHRGDRIERVNAETERVLRDLGLWEVRAMAARQLAYGVQRQLELALALAMQPRILLLDEPTAGMSPAETNEIVALLRTLPSELTLLIIEHDMDVIFALAKKVTALHYGQVIADGDAESVRNDPRVLEVYLGEKERSMDPWRRFSN